MRNIIFLILIFLFSSLNSAFSETKDIGTGGRNDLSFLNVKTSNFKKGTDALKQASKLQKKNKNKRANKRYNDAIGYFLLAYKNYPDNPEILYYLAFTYNITGDLIMAEIYYQEGLALDPKNNIINEKLGKLYFDTKRIDLAKERLKALKSCDCKEYLSLKNIIGNY